MTVLSLKLSRVLDMNTQDALELFMKNQKFLLLPKADICCFTLLGYCHLWELSAMAVIFNLIRIFMKGNSAIRSAENKEIRSAKKHK